MQTGKHVLFLTSTNLCCNPRCLKEVRLLVEMNVSVTVVAFNLHNWTRENEKELNKELPSVNFHYLETTRKNLVSWFLPFIIEKSGRFLFSIFSTRLFCASIALSKRSWLLLNSCKITAEKHDLIIAHNPAAFYPAYWLAKKNNIPFAIDIEDYHPGENLPVSVKKSVTLLMKQLLPKAVYTSFASQLIKVNTEKLLNATGSFIVINNLFSKDEFIEPVLNNYDTTKIKLVWFSQYIDYGRGLEKILPVLDKFQDDFELILIGKIREAFFKNELKDRNYICCKDSMPHAILQKELSKYDVGLAIEDGTIDFNRDICLTNKIWSYFQAGLFIIASDTEAQKVFIKEHPEHGVIASLVAEKVEVAMNDILLKMECIKASKPIRFQHASAYNWENESIKLKKKWKEILF